MGRFESLTKEFLEAANRRDIEAVLATYAKDCVVEDPLYPAPLVGHDAVREDFAAFFRAFPDLRFEVLELLEKDNLGAAEMRLTGTNIGPLTTPAGEMPPSGQRVDLRAAGYVELTTE